MATGQGFRFALLAAAPNWTDGVNNILRRQAARGSGDGLASRQAPLTRDDGFAGFEDRWPSCAMDSAVNAATTHEGRVRGIHDGIAGFAGDVALSGDDQRTLRRERDTE